MADRAPREPLLVIAALCAAALALAIYLLRLDDIAGLMVDDAWYVMLGRAIAAGGPYGLVNSPTGVGMPPYPPGLPALLAPLFLVSPEFPGNVWLLKAPSIAAMMLVGVATYGLVASRQLPRWLALALAFATVITPAFVFLATSTVMAECVFTLAQLLAVLYADRAARGSRRDTVAAGLLAAGAYLVRSAGVAAIAGVALYLAGRRRWREALLFTVVAGLCLAPWLWYARAHAPTLRERLEHGGGYAFSYGQNFWMRWAGTPTAGYVGVADLPARVAANVFDVVGRDVAGIITPSLFRGPSESGEETISLGGGLFPASMGSAAGTVALSFVLSAFIIAGYVVAVRRGITAAEIVVPLSLTVTLLWPYWAYRFVLPLTPFLLLYLVRGLRLVAPVRAVRILILSFIGLNVLDHGLYILQSRSAVLDWQADANEANAVIEWMQRNIADEAYVATTNPALIYLRTGHRTVAMDDIRANWPRWKAHGVRYVVCLRRSPLPSADIPYTVRYRSPVQGLWVIEI